LLGENTKDNNHLINCFSWGNNKSLLNGRKIAQEGKKLWTDLNKFFNDFYSPSRMSVVVQVRTENPDHVIAWMTQSFACIKAKPHLGR
jgi:secreted Zn-dependent insulinase-like peptidase